MTAVLISALLAVIFGLSTVIGFAGHLLMRRSAALAKIVEMHRRRRPTEMVVHAMAAVAREGLAPSCERWVERIRAEDPAYRDARAAGGFG